MNTYFKMWLTYQNILYTAKPENIILKKFLQFGGQGPKSRPFLFYQSTQLTKNDLWGVCGFYTFEGVQWDNEKYEKLFVEN